MKTELKILDKKEDKIEKENAGKVVRYTNVERVSITQFENISKENKPFITFTINMSFKNDKGEYQRGHSFSLRDLLAVRTAVDRAINIFLDEQEYEKKEEK